MVAFQRCHILETQAAGVTYLLLVCMCKLVASSKTLALSTTVWGFLVIQYRVPNLILPFLGIARIHVRKFVRVPNSLPGRQPKSS